MLEKLLFLLIFSRGICLHRLNPFADGHDSLVGSVIELRCRRPKDWVVHGGECEGLSIFISWSADALT